MLPHVSPATADALRSALLPTGYTTDGVRALLGSWLHVRGEDWPDRVRSWLPAGLDGHGVDAWVIQREVADPALHVGTWQRDAGLDPASPAARAQAGVWLDWMDREQVEAIGFGLLTLRRTDGRGTEVFEDLPGAVDDPLGPEVEGWLDRLDGPRWRHEVDEPAAALLAGCGGALPLRELVELLAFAHDRPVGELVEATLPAVREFVRHGVLVPA